MGKRVFSRRELLRTGLAGAAVAAAPAGALTSVQAVAPVTQAPTGGGAQVRQPFETLSAAESEILETIVSRLIPTDANGPGAIEAGAAHYIDRA